MSLGEKDASAYEEIESARSFVPMFVAGLSGLKRCRFGVPRWCSQSEEFTRLHLLFESQNESIITSMLGSGDVVRTVDLDKWHSDMSPYDSYVLGYCISLSIDVSGSWSCIALMMNVLT